jgi:hypothetical protein
MKDKETSSGSRSEHPTSKPTEFERRLAMLKTEVSLDFPNLIPQLEAGQQVVLITDRKYAQGLEPDILRRFGGMVMLCCLYGAAIVFVNEDKILELEQKRDA